METQPKFINFRASEEIREMLRYLAKQTKRSQSNYMRWIIEREYEQHSPTGDNGNQSEGKD